MIFRSEIAKLYNVPFEPDAEVMKPAGAEEAVDYSFSQGVPLIDFGAGAVGPPPLPFERQIGFDFKPPPGSASAPPPAQRPANKEKSDHYVPSDEPAEPPVDSSPPPTYDTIVPNDRPVPKPRTTVNSDLFPELPNVPRSTPVLPKTPGDEETIDFDDLAKRFEALKKRK